MLLSCLKAVALYTLRFLRSQPDILQKRGGASRPILYAQSILPCLPCEAVLSEAESEVEGSPSKGVFRMGSSRTSL